MNEKETAELRRRYRPNKNGITHIHGCCVNEKREIISQFHQPLSLMPEGEAEKLLAVLRRTLSGMPGKNLIDIEFTTSQVMAGEEHKLLMALRNSALEDDAAVQALFGRVLQSVTLDGNYLILLAHDTYDVPYRSQDGEKQDDASSEVFSYILCCVCPVKMTKPALSYDLCDNEFHSCPIDWLVSPPELGFLFPAFDDRSANLYNALYYTRDTAESHLDFVNAVFQCEVPMPAAMQKETFQSLLENTLAEDCSYDVVQTVHEELCGLIAEHKENKESEPLVISKSTVKQVLESCGVSETHITVFEERYDAEFGTDAELSPQNIVETKQFEISTPDVTIHVNPSRSDLVETRIIDGAKYILIRADESVEVNGVNIQFLQ